MADRRKSDSPSDTWQKVREPRKPSTTGNPTKPETGINPYDTFPNLRAGNVGERQADLRRLSEWIRLKRQVAALKGGKLK